MDHAQVVNAVARITPEILVPRYKLNHCIAAARHGLTVFEYFGVKARPQKMQTVVGNDAWFRWIEADRPGGSLPDDGSWAVGIDIDEIGDGGYPGHLVLVAQLDGADYLVDLNCGQFARPERGIDMPAAAVLPLPADWRTREFLWYRDEHDNVLFHKPLPQRDWQSAPDWKRKPPHAGEIIRAVREEVS